jgi:hypothetical protein
MPIPALAHCSFPSRICFTADGDFVDGLLYHAGMMLQRED